MSTSSTLEPRLSPPQTTVKSRVRSVTGPRSVLRDYALALASLKLTVWLFAMTIFLVLAGTLAQVNQGIWQVVDEYFRSFFVWIKFSVFVPASFFPNAPQLDGGFLFPGGWTLGILLSANLAAAHMLRFRIRAKGKRRLLGFGLLGLGLLITWQVVASGSSGEGIQAEPWINWSALWNLFLLGWAGVACGLLIIGFKLDPAQTRERRSLFISGMALLCLLLWQLSQGAAARLDDSSMRILWQLTKGTAAGIVLLGGCIMLFRQRAGIVLLHGGIGLLMFNELLVGLTAVESSMQLYEGQTVNYVEDIRSLELAIVDPSNAEADDVVVVPQSRLSDGKFVSNTELPFDIRVNEYLPNSVLRKLPENAANIATTGLGLQWAAERVRPVSGTDTNGRINQSAAYLTFLNKEDGKELGTHLVSLMQSSMQLPEKVKLADKNYKVYLRFKRNYKPYRLSLIDVRKDDYLGTNTPRNYSSQLKLNDESRGISDRDVKIWMNNPLRFAGETFYQSGYFRDPQSGIESTTLQVVTNTGWMIPYVACMIVTTGLLAHFLVALRRFLLQRDQNQTDTVADLAATTSLQSRLRQSLFAWKTWIVPACIVLLSAGWLASKARVPTPPSGEMNLYEFRAIPVIYQGRAKPIDTLARNSLRILSDRQTFQDASGQRQPAVRWLLDVIANPEAASQHKVFRIENPEVLQTLGLAAKPGFRYSHNEIQPRLSDLTKQATLSKSLKQHELTVFHKKVLEVDRKLGLYDLLLRSFRDPVIRKDASLSAVDLHIAQQQQQALAQSSPPLLIPPQSATDEWMTSAQTALNALAKKDGSDDNKFWSQWNEVRNAYVANDASAFNTAVASYRQLHSQRSSSDVGLQKIDFEAYFNHFSPFYYAAVLYVLAFILLAVSWLGWKRPLGRSAYWLVVFTFLVHTGALIARIYISGRPPVTNLYSSAIFIGWGCVLLGIILESVHRIGMGILISPIAGFSTLLIAHFLAGDGDTIAVMRAVLDTQFWLATHVVCITLGYSTTYVAGLLAIFYVVRGVFTPTLQPSAGKDLTRMIYGTICFATFFSFVGTVLGGLWADDSWGRFWGWDPKENGALMIVLWNALVLHAYWGNMVKARGLALLAIAGNIVVSWSWFGVNELGVGLHSYGFTEGVMLSLLLFVASQVFIIVVGCLPRGWWWSQRRHQLL